MWLSPDVTMGAVAAEASPPPDAVAVSEAVASKVVAVVVTHDRPVLLNECLRALGEQRRPPDLVIVVDNASGLETTAVIARFDGVRTLCLASNLGGAAGFQRGMAAALADGADHVWLMDDDGRPEDPACLERLLAVADLLQADMVAPLVVDAADRDRLAFPIRLHGRTLFTADAVSHLPVIDGFAHLFNGVLVTAALIRRIGQPDPRFFIRGDEVEFLYRARHAGARIVLHTATRFVHPSSAAEIFPIMFGAFYAVAPPRGFKRFHPFRNRAHIFRAYRMWVFLGADILRYGWFFLVTQRGDMRGLLEWAKATAAGLHGGFMKPPHPAGGQGVRGPDTAPRHRELSPVRAVVGDDPPQRVASRQEPSHDAADPVGRRTPGRTP